MRIFAGKRKVIMNRKIVLIVLTALALISTGCAKKSHVIKSIAIIGAPESAVLVGEKFSLNVDISPEDADARAVVWSSSDPAVAKVNADGHVLATGGGECEISATAGKASDKVAISVNDRDPARDEMGHVGTGKIERGRNNTFVTFSLGNTGWMGEILYQGGNNYVAYYDNGTFNASWNGTNDYILGIGYYYDKDSDVDPEDMQYDCYFRHTRTGSAGGYSYIGLHGWTMDPLVEFYIVDDWYNKPGVNLLGQKKGEFTVDGTKYEIYQNQRVQQPSITGTQTYPQYFSVRTVARQSGHIDASAHFKKFESLGMRMGKMYELMYYIEAGGGTGSLDCTYFFMSDGRI